MSRSPPHRDAVTVAAVRLPRSAAEAPSQSGRRTGAVVAERYQLLDRIGRGGMGEVWRARHVTLHTEVAVKFPSLAAGGHAATMIFERFRFEAQVAARLGLASRHVVAVHDAGCDGAGPYLVMEHVRGRTLEQEIDDRPSLPLPWVATVVAQVAEALAAAHAHGVVHRDLKPSNLLLSADAGGGLLVKVADFGIAKVLGLGGEAGQEAVDLHADLPEDTTGGAMIGSPPYMSPEQLGGGVASAQADLWSLAVIAYEAVTGRLPFPGRSFASLLASHAEGRFDPPGELRAGVPAPVDAWFHRALAKEEARRFGTAKEMAAALGEAVAAPVAQPRRGWTARLRLLVS